MSIYIVKASRGAISSEPTVWLASHSSLVGVAVHALAHQVGHWLSVLMIGLHHGWGGSRLVDLLIVEVVVEWLERLWLLRAIREVHGLEFPRWWHVAGPLVEGGTGCWACVHQVACRTTIILVLIDILRILNEVRIQQATSTSLLLPIVLHFLISIFQSILIVISIVLLLMLSRVVIA